MTRVLADRTLDRRLRVHGFAQLRLVGATEAASLLSIHRGLRGEHGEGFEADLNNPDPAYRRSVAAALEPHLAPRLREVFVDHEPFLWNFLCKWPHTDDELYLHRDWMFVDERTGARSCSIWIALQDVTGHNGQLRVLPGSHLLGGAVSGTGISPRWVEHRSAIDPRLVAVPLRAGEALVLDHALVHSSYGNHTDEARVGIGVALRPAGQPLVHFRRLDDDQAERFDVDPDFFVDQTPEALEERPPAPEADERFAIRDRDLEAPEVARLLDGRLSLSARLGGRIARRPAATRPG